MSRTDLIADCFTIIRNGLNVQKEEVVIPYSKVMLRIAEILKEEGYIENVKELEAPGFKTLKIYLRYDRKKSVIHGLKKISRGGRRRYVGKDTMPRVLRGYGVAIVSTSKGIMTDPQARRLGVGGEVIGYVW